MPGSQGRNPTAASSWRRVCPLSVFVSISALPFHKAPRSYSKLLGNQTNFFSSLPRDSDLEICCRKGHVPSSLRKVLACWFQTNELKLIALGFIFFRKSTQALLGKPCNFTQGKNFSQYLSLIQILILRLEIM